MHTAYLVSDGCCWCKDSRHCQALGPNSVPAGTPKSGILKKNRMTRITAPSAQSSVTISTTASLSPNQSEKPLKQPVPLSQFKVLSLPEHCPRELLLKTCAPGNPKGQGTSLGQSTTLGQSYTTGQLVLREGGLLPALTSHSYHLLVHLCPLDLLPAPPNRLHL